MRDINDAQPALPQAPKRSEQAIHFRRRERGSRLVKDHDLRVGHKRARNLDHLLMRHAQRRDDRQRTHGYTKAVQQTRRTAEHCGPVQQRTAELATEKDIVRHGEVRNEREFLVHHADAVASHGVRIEPHSTGIGDRCAR